MLRTFHPKYHPRRPRGYWPGRCYSFGRKFSSRAEEPLGTYSYRTGGPFLEAPCNYRAREAVLFSVKDGSFKSFENGTGKLLVKETKWASLEVRIQHTILENLISKYDTGPVKLPGLLRNGPQFQKWSNSVPLIGLKNIFLSNQRRGLAG